MTNEEIEDIKYHYNLKKYHNDEITKSEIFIRKYKEGFIERELELLAIKFPSITGKYKLLDGIYYILIPEDVYKDEKYIDEELKISDEFRKIFNDSTDLCFTDDKFGLITE